MLSVPGWLGKAQGGCAGGLAASSAAWQRTQAWVHERAASARERWGHANTQRLLGMPKGWALVSISAASTLLLVLLLSTTIPLSRRRGAGGGEGPGEGPPPPEFELPPEKPVPQRPGVAMPHEFVRVNRRLQLESNCKPVYIVGFNAYDLTEMVLTISPAAATSDDPSLDPGLDPNLDPDPDPGALAADNAAQAGGPQQGSATATASGKSGNRSAGTDPRVQQGAAHGGGAEGQRGAGAAWLPGPGHTRVAASLASAAALGLNTLRTWAHTSNPLAPFQVSPGVYSEQGLRALDFVLHQASLLRLRVILCLVDNWQYYNGVDQYVDWSTTAPARIFDRPPDVPGDPAPERLRGDLDLGGQELKRWPWEATYALNSTGRTRPWRRNRTAGNDTGFGADAAAADVDADGNLGNGSGARVGRNGSGASGTQPQGSEPPEPSLQELLLYEKSRHALFWTDPGARQLYRNHAKAITQRRNTFSGKLYWQDPTILAWDLVNEPRCEARPGCHDALQLWIQEMSAHVKSLAPMQLVTIGSEGFFGPSTPELLEFNPGEWAAHVGQDFVRNNAPDTIDFATIHAWPDNWGVGKPNPAAAADITPPSVNNSAAATAAPVSASSTAADLIPGMRFLSAWVYSHLYLTPQAGAMMVKPVLLEEFGKKLPPPTPPPTLATSATVSGVQQPQAFLAASGSSGQQANASQLRDPIFRSAYGLVQRRAAMQITRSSGQSEAAAVEAAQKLLRDPSWGEELSGQGAAVRAASTGRHGSDGGGGGGGGSGRGPVLGASPRPLPLVGSLFWKWSSADASIDEYGVGAAQSTSRVIAGHAAVLRRLLSHAPPPQPACVAALQQERVRAAAEAADTP